VLHNVDVQDHRLCSGTRHVWTGCRYILLVFFFWVRDTCLHDRRCLQLTCSHEHSLHKIFNSHAKCITCLSTKELESPNIILQLFWKRVINRPIGLGLLQVNRLTKEDRPNIILLLFLEVPFVEIYISARAGAIAGGPFTCTVFFTMGEFYFPKLFTVLPLQHQRKKQSSVMTEV